MGEMNKAAICAKMRFALKNDELTALEKTLHIAGGRGEAGAFLH
jgi:hypothetical protein